MRRVLTHLVTAGVVAVVILTWRGTSPVRRVEAQTEPKTGNQAPARGVESDRVAEALARADADELANIQVYAKTNRGVVHLTTEASGAGLFGDESQSGSGSGFVVDRQGHVVTNYHVVADADTLEVKLADGSSYRGRIIGVDPSLDVAVVKLEDVPPEKLVPLALGDSSKLLVGMKVLAVGNPFGLERTLTTGIVSSLDRSIRARNGRLIKGMIQTDAAINPGNSGGPLLNRHGEVLGMNTAIVSQVNQYSGISFAVPINAIARILPQLLQHGRVIRADLGIARAFTPESERGIYIVSIVDGGPADRAGLRPMQLITERLGGFIRRRIDPSTADRVIAIDGEPVRSLDELLTRVEAHAPGDTVTVTVIREGAMVDVKVELGESGT